MNTNPIKAVIFDMDGVLIDAQEWHYESLNKALELFGHRISRYEHLVTYDGLPTKKKLEMLSMETSLPRGLHPLINNMKQKYTIEMAFCRCRPIFTHQRALSNLKKEGFLLGMCSNSIRKSVDIMMEKSNLGIYLDKTLSNEDVLRPKPASEIYDKIISEFGLAPDQCLIVEDNEKGIKAAQASGAHLFKVDGVQDVTYENILSRIAQISKSVQF